MTWDAVYPKARVLNILLDCHLERHKRIVLLVSLFYPRRTGRPDNSKLINQANFVKCVECLLRIPELNNKIATLGRCSFRFFLKRGRLVILRFFPRTSKSHLGPLTSGTNSGQFSILFDILVPVRQVHSAIFYFENYSMNQYSINANLGSLSVLSLADVLAAVSAIGDLIIN